jgi:hypothetical protein
VTGDNGRGDDLLGLVAVIAPIWLWAGTILVRSVFVSDEIFHIQNSDCTK